MVKDQKKKKINKSDYGKHFIQPDGGYGWFICLTSGLANLSVIVAFDQFGLLYRDKLLGIGLNHSAITSTINLCIAIYSLTGFLNGPIFRRFSYRQVGITGSLIVTIAMFLISLSNSLESFLLTFGVLLGFGGGITYSANCVVLNVYFKEKRSQASSLAWTVTGIGPIIFPYFITYLMQIYGVQGTLLVIAGISANSIAFSMTYQPVQWHAKKNKIVEQKLEILNKTEDTEIDSDNTENNSFLKQIPEDEKKSMILAGDKPSQLPVAISECIDSTLKPLTNGESTNGITHSKLQPKISICRKFVKYFELDLLKDLTFLNILFGLTLTSFSEHNFVFLTPFFLSDYELENHQIAFLITIPAILDLVCRFLIQFLVKKVKWHNRIFYLLGIFGMAIFRTIIALRPPYLILCISFCCLGVGRAFLTIFYGILIPDHVSLKSLPAALGINRLIDGFFPLIFGPLIGIIRDYSDYQASLHFLNSMLFIMIISWTVEIFFFQKKKKESNSVTKPELV